MNVQEIIAVMTGVELTEVELYGRKATPVRRLLVAIASKIEMADRELERAAKQAEELATKIRANLSVKPGERYSPLSATGEMSGSTLGRVDAIIARRASLIEELQMVMSLDREPKEVSRSTEPSGTPEMRNPERPALRLTEVKPMTIKGFND